ncbi:MAG: hypothetical protein VW999_13330, partial [Alphaproteobacteria bacterium]
MAKHRTRAPPTALAGALFLGEKPPHRRQFVVLQPLSPSFFAVVFQVLLCFKKMFCRAGGAEDQKKVKSPELDFFLPFFLFFCLLHGGRAGRWALAAQLTERKKDPNSSRTFFFFLSAETDDETFYRFVLP